MEDVSPKMTQLFSRKTWFQFLWVLTHILELQFNPNVKLISPLCVLLGERITYDATEPVYFAHDARILRNFCPASDPIGEALHLRSDEASEQGEERSEREKKLSINIFLGEGRGREGGKGERVTCASPRVRSLVGRGRSFALCVRVCRCRQFAWRRAHLPSSFT